jgi:hypothetical protein
MGKLENTTKWPKNPLDRVSKKRGRPRMVSATETIGRAGNYRWILDQVWDRVWPTLSTAQTAEDVISAFREARPYEKEFMPDRASIILQVLRERGFPKRRKAMVNFLADSLAGLERVTPRRSRDICAKERAKTARSHHIIRYEFYVECSCGYKGYSRDHACAECGAVISPSFSGPRWI